MTNKLRNRRCRHLWSFTSVLDCQQCYAHKIQGWRTTQQLQIQAAAIANMVCPTIYSTCPVSVHSFKHSLFKLTRGLGYRCLIIIRLLYFCNRVYFFILIALKSRLLYAGTRIFTCLTKQSLSCLLAILIIPSDSSPFLVHPSKMILSNSIALLSCTLRLSI